MNKTFKAIFAAGLTAGILDISAAVLVFAMGFRVATPVKILQSVAGGIYGKETYKGDLQTAGIGLLLHFIIALIWATLFVLIYPRVKKLRINILLCGIIYGCIVWGLMNYAVVPLSAYGHPQKWSWKYSTTNLAIIIICVGIPISWITAEIYKEKEQHFT